VIRPTVADLVIDGLRRAGTRRVFACAPAPADLPLLDAARAGGLAVTVASHESGACIMAAVTGDLVDAPSAVLIGEDVAASVPAPGVTDAPLIVLAGGRASAPAGCKETLRVDATSAAHRIAHAVRLAMTEPRGPVRLELAEGVARAAAVPVATSCRPDPLPYPDAAALDQAGRVLAEASRPLLLAGIHCRSAEAAQWLRAFVEALPAPLLATARAKGALPDPHPLMLGVLGVGGVEERLVSRADLVVAMGLGAGEAESLAAACWAGAPVLVLGPAAIPGGRVPAARVVGDVGAIIEELATRLRDMPRADWDVAEVDRLRREAAARGAGDGLVAGVVRLAREATPAGTIAAVDAGGYRDRVVTAWHATAPREFLVPDGDAPGFALPAAIAAHLAHPDRRVVCFTGPDELSATAAELETAARLAAPVVIVVFEVDETRAFTSARLGERAGLAVSTADGEMKFAQAFSRALAATGAAMIVVRP
jgi:acetolactate synthase-1/2/3 large subunit